jgi:hypothetical protein
VPHRAADHDDFPADSKQPDMFRVTELEKQPNKVIAEAFRERLKKVAGFTYVPEPLPMTNSKNAVVYYLFFAARNPAAGNIIESIFTRARKGAYRTLRSLSERALDVPANDSARPS